MALPKGWSIKLILDGYGSIQNVDDIRAICPHCNQATIFASRGHYFERLKKLTYVHLLLECSYSDCRRIMYVLQLTHLNEIFPDGFFMYPSRAVEPAHPSVPSEISEDWVEAQRAMQASAPKAAAVMFRRVLYGILLDKSCKVYPISEGLKELIAKERLPAIFDKWLPAIKDDGHDAAHPDRALQVSAENVAETMEYTAELLRYLYKEPYEFEQRRNRNNNSMTPAATMPTKG